jgi:hypothetical protein
MAGMDDDLSPLVKRYQEQAAVLVPHELYRLARSDGLSSDYAAVILRKLYGLGMSECVQVMRDFGDDPLVGSE